ncbi:MAG: hypothetical protein ABIL77_01090 [candidate division WOR-3 bacterium]
MVNIKKIIGLFVLGVGLLNFSCKKQEIAKDETVTFLTGINNVGTDITQTNAYKVFTDFISKNPPIEVSKKNVKIISQKISVPYKLCPKEFKGGIEDYYGTWEWQDTGWVHVDPDNPRNGILFRWNYTDENYQSHVAKVLIDSIETQVISNDTLPTRLHIGVFLDDNKLADFSFTASYNTNGEPTYVKVVVTIIGYGQVGLELKNLVWEEDEYGDRNIVAGTIHLWIIDYNNHNYRIDLTLTIKQDKSLSILLADSDGWKVSINVSKPQTIIENGIPYTKRTVSGEITKDGRHAADITGIIWEPEDDNHRTFVDVIFTDGSREPLQKYLTLIPGSY